MDQDGYNSFHGFDDKSECFTTALDSQSSCSEMPDHAHTQQQLSQTLEPEIPSFLWEQTGFLGAVFGKKNLVDELFPCASLKRPPSAVMDLTEGQVLESPIKKAFELGRKRPAFLQAIKHSTILHEDTQRQNCINSWTSIVLVNVSLLHRVMFHAINAVMVTCDKRFKQR